MKNLINTQTNKMININIYPFWGTTGRWVWGWGEGGKERRKGVVSSLFQNNYTAQKSSK